MVSQQSILLDVASLASGRHFTFVPESSELKMLSQHKSSSRLFLPLICLILFFCFSQPVLPGPLINYGIANLMGNDQITTRQFNQRFGFNASYYYEDLISAPQLLIEEVDGLSLLSDWHPGKGTFRLSAGVLYQPEQASNTSYGLSLSQPDMAGGLARVSNDGVSHYVGLGWGSNLKQQSQLGYNLDMGLLYQPDRRLLEPAADFGHDDRNLNSQLESLELSPVFSLGVSYNF